jgi:hypothetical protein
MGGASGRGEVLGVLEHRQAVGEAGLRLAKAAAAQNV